ncbi:hypothetical protein D6D19_10099 [Aureobasidium pullulans]|uniref:Uncharacterized protein n=2 Tax=Aureobasidium pullulans TaxID=5580 RepID=A0A074XE80_AURPU|nr:uncharacterized protein M438DRAFT_346615 [Aureobasidium pullulans EXF-150]KEQ83693.1 hypothetical protein M438DRAFT_346615 [Aureobasidium pullulans EXF-150]THW60501.1 hypothetical protein D6D19_10099 [Aureobasidium pullulans]THY12077.1 hypothetical protein D6D00_10522 [Aureobasidium pullulans]
MPTTSPDHDNRTFMERMSDALVYVLAFPFIIFGIALKRAFTQGGEHHSYRNNLPAQKRI